MAQSFLRLAAGLLFIGVPSLVRAQLPVYGDTTAHDPSRLIKQGNTYYDFWTSQGIMSKTSTDLRNWTAGATIFPGNPPSWTTNAVPGFTGDFWAPDIVYLNGTYYLYYAVSTFGSQVSAIGLVTTTNLASGSWTDQGAVIQSTNGSAYNCIDPCPLLDTNGTMWMTFGSYWNGIYIVQLDPTTGKRITPTSTVTRVAYNSSIEGSFVYQRDGYYYLFVNWNTCCDGISSTYNIRVGRATVVTGPYFDQKGITMANNGGTMFLESTARYIGPGQAGIMNDNGTNWLTYHYYDGNNNGAPTLGLGILNWNTNNWPAFTNDWSAFYPFNASAREHLGLYNGTLKNNAVITNEPGRGNVLSLDGVSQYVSLPDPVANASTFAGWVKWNGGAAWQRIFDFGASNTSLLYLTPSDSVGKMRFGINTNATEQFIEAPYALPTNSWCHVAVTLDGTNGLLYLDGLPIATNSNLTIRPWWTLARTNYLGRSLSTADPYFGGRIDSFRIFGRALTAPEIKDLAYAHPALAHRYSFTNNAWDSIGMAHGTLLGNAVVTNGSLVLDGVSGDYLNLPGGLVSGSSAATFEFWATFGSNGDWARVFDFGTNSGANGQNFLFFTPHNATDGVQIGMSTPAGGADVIAPGLFDNLTLHVVCIVNPSNSYGAIYTNGILALAQSGTIPALNGVNSSWSFVGRSLFSADAWLNASIDEFRIYDGQLTPAEIAADDAYSPDALALPITLIQSNTAGGLTLSWPSWAVGFLPQYSGDLAGDWTPLAMTPTLAADQWSVTIPPTNAVQFYRLQR